METLAVGLRVGHPGGLRPGRSDVDFLVEFESDPDLNTFHPYMDLRDELSCLPGHPVDLVMPSGLRNRYVAQEIEATREPLHGA